MSVSALGSAQAFAYSPPSARPASAAGSAESGAAAGRSVAGRSEGLSEADLKIVSELKARDRVVRAHEMAHMAAGAGIGPRGASFSYQTGPDGQRYPAGGEDGLVRLALKVAARLPAIDHGEMVEEPVIEAIDVDAME